MKFFLDSANLGEIREAAELGLIDGVTTNPSLISKEGGVDFKEHIASICEIVAGDVSAEVAKAGAAYVSPFVGRLDDVGQNGLAVLAEIVEIFRNYEWRTQVLASSIRHPIHVVEAARMGADVATMPLKVLNQLFQHPLTDKGLEKFLSDWHKGERK
jgi:transaldolase